MPNPSYITKRILIATGSAILYALVLRVFFGVRSWHELYSVMSISFLFCLPTIMGMITVYLSPEKYAQKKVYQCFMPWIPVFAFLIITLVVSLEGWGCWLMILPLFLAAASLGGYIGAFCRFRNKSNTLHLSVVMVLPLLCAPIESMIGASSKTYKANTYTDIHASANHIWKNVTRVREIPANEDKGWLTRSLGFPRPVKAELDYNGVGGYRKAIFTNGLIFHETVTQYHDQQSMIFTIKANPYDIPSTTMDEHIVIGGSYFDVLEGTYRLEKRGKNHFRLHLSSSFRLNTTFNFYAGLWAKWIMKDIQQNILQVEKKRAEQPD